MKKKIIIDTDPGVDDAMAILFALQSPELELVGLTAIFGNVYVDLAAQNALRLLELAQSPHIPVAQGANAPLVVSLDRIGDFVHGADGLGEIYLPSPQGQALAQPAAQFIVETVMAHPGQVTLVPIGPLTNLALALALEPRLAENVAEVVLMGGAATVNGNVNVTAEANIYHDPHAADIVFTAAWPVTMMGLDVTTKPLMSEAYLTSLKEVDSQFGAFIYQISRFYQNFYQQRSEVAGIYAHDVLPLAYLIAPDLFAFESGPLRVVTEGIARGQTMFDRSQNWAFPNPWSDQPAIQVCLDVDVEGLLTLYRDRLLRP